MAEKPPENLKETEEMNRNGSSSTPNQFQGTQFGKTNHVTGEVWKVSYEKQTLERLTKAIEAMGSLLQRGAHFGQGVMYLWTNVSHGNTSEAPPT